MAKLGEIKQGGQLGRKGGHRFMWSACVDCGKERWVQFVKGEIVSLRCQRCNNKRTAKIGPSSPLWKGGRQCHGHGYVAVTLQPDDFFYPMADSRGRVMEHRLVMAQHLKRCLLPWEIVHHRNGIRNQNRLENLELVKGNGRHNTAINRQLKQQARQIQELKAMIEALEEGHCGGTVRPIKNIEAFTEGQQASRDHKSDPKLADNPYPEGSDDWKDWNYGWNWDESWFREDCPRERAQSFETGGGRVV